MKNLYKWLFGFVVLFAVVGAWKVEKAEGATDICINAEQINYDTLPTYQQVVDWVVQYYGVSASEVSADNTVMFCSDGVGYSIFYGSAIDKLECYGLSNGSNINAKSSVYKISYNGDTGNVSYSSFSGSFMSVKFERDTYMGYVWGKPVYCWSRNGVTPYINAVTDYPVDLSNMSFVDINVNGVDYSISEPYPYYLALKDIRGNVLLLFSDVPFTGKMYDMYKSQFSVSPTSNVVSYLYSVSSNNDFLESRSESFGYESFLTTNKDYFCNYHVHHTDDLLNIFLPEKESFDTEVTQTLENLCLTLPEELQGYRNFIIFQQMSKKAYDDRIIFYGWDDVFSELYINIDNSQICAIGKKGAVSNFVTAYYDELNGVWVVSDDVVLGATTDNSYSVPHIYYTTSTLYIAYSDWSNSGNVAQYADFYPAPFPESGDAEEETQESLLDKFLNGFISGNSNVLKYLFIPSEDYFTTQFAQMQLYFSFWTSVRDTANVFMDFLKNTDFTEPPKIEIDLSLANSSVNYGGKVYLIDLSWYEPYKDSVDIILSSILWLVFVWNTYKNLPNIISGINSGVQASASLLDDGKEE